MKLLDIIREQRNQIQLTDAQVKKIRSIHKALKTGRVKIHFKSLDGDKVYHLRYELPDTFKPFITAWNKLGIEYEVNMSIEDKPEFPCKIWLMDPEEGETLLNDKLTTYDRDVILFGSGDSGWKTSKDLSPGRLYLQALSKVYTKFLMFNIAVHMYPSED
jgi:hypothetical protein